MAHGELNHIEFPADDPERAMRFYGAVAGWQFGAIDGFPDYWMFRTSEGYGGAVGKRNVSTGSQLRNYIDVTSIDAALVASDANGGATVEPKTAIPGMGWYAVVRDTEGTEIGLFESGSQG